MDDQKIQELNIALGWSLFKVQEQSTIQESLTESVMDMNPHYLLNPIHTSYVLKNGEAITFPPGRFLYISSDALHVTAVHLSPQLIATSEQKAFDLTTQIEDQFRSAGLIETQDMRTPHEEAKQLLQNRTSGFPIRVRLYEYALDKTRFFVEIATFEPEKYAIFVRITNRELATYWVKVAARIAKDKAGPNVPIATEVDAEEYILKLKELGYLNDN